MNADPKRAVFSRAEVSAHCRPEDAWVVDGKVYDVTECMKRHPPGLEVVKKHLGGDISQLFRTIHSKPTQQRLLTMQVGVLARSSVVQLGPTSS